MALIRQAQAVRMSQQAITLDLGDLAAQAQALMTRARAQADAILDEARAERARLIASAEHAGLQQGKAKGLEQGLREGQEKGAQQALAQHHAALTKLQEQWASQLQAFSQAREELLLLAGEQVVELSLLLAHRIVRAHIKANPALVVEQALAALRLATGASRLVLRVHADDVPLLEQAMPRLLEACRGPSEAHIRIEPLQSIERGSVIVDIAGGGRIEATISGQLDRLTELLLGKQPAPAQQEPA
jgi:flagellar biosynthesis/type III secretory pathway protein FliH